MKSQHKNRLVIFISILALLVPVLTLLVPTTASAAAYSSLSVEDKARAYTYYRAAASCMSGLKNEIVASAEYNGLKTDPANGYWYGTGDKSNPDRKGDWWSGDAKNEAEVTPKSTSSDGLIGCTEITKTGLSEYWGGATPADLLKALKYEWNGTDKWVFKGDGSKKSDYLKAFLTSKGVSMEYTPATEYFVNYNAFVNKNYCNAKDNGTYNSLSESIRNRYETYNTGSNAYQGKTVYKKVTVADSVTTSDHGFTYTGPSGGVVNLGQAQFTLYYDNYKSCDAMAKNISDNAPAYLDAVAREVCVAHKFAGSVLAACIDGVKHSATETAPTYCNKYTDQSLKEACVAGIGLRPETPDVATDPSSGGEDGDETSSCVVEGVGWIVCPVVNFLAGITDAIYGIVENFLKIDVKTISADPNASGSYQAWTIMRNIANVMLVIAFIFIIYSQLTGMGVSNYGIKKTLPRLIVAALLINLSFFVCQIAVDISNILGGSLKSFLANLPVFTDTSGGNWAQDTLAKGNFFTNAALGILAGQATIGLVAGAAVAVYFLGIGIFIPIVVAAVIAILITFFILLARQMLVIILVVVAPVAFAAMLLPNTERWFKWWQKAFVGILVIYPLIALLFGGSQLAANILVQTKPGDLGWQLAGAAVAILPLFFTPALLKGSLNAIPAIGGLAQKLQSRAVNGGRKLTGEGMKRLGERAAAGNSRFASRVSGAIHGNGRGGRRRQAAAQRAYEEPRIKDLMTQWTKPGKNGERAIADNSDALADIAMRSPESLEGQTAISLLASKQDAVTLSRVRNSFKGNENKMSAYNKAISPSYGALKAKHPGAVQDMDEKAWSSMKQADMQGMKDAALQEGAASSASFRSSLAAAMQDPEQARHFTDDMYTHLNEKYGMGVSRPSNVQRAQQAATATPAAANAAAAASQGTPGTGSATQQQNAMGAAQRAQQTAAEAAAGTSGSKPFVATGEGEVSRAVGAAERARQTAEQSAQGTSGDGVFVVSHDEGITQPQQPVQPTQAVPQPGTPAGQASTTVNEHGQMGVAGQHEDTIDRMSR